VSSILSRTASSSFFFGASTPVGTAGFAGIGSGHSFTSGPDVPAAASGRAAAAGDKSRTVQYGFDVVKARKRSAVVSILLVDVPFCCIRTVQYGLSIKASEMPAASNPSALSGTLAATSVMTTLPPNATGPQVWASWTPNLGGLPNDEAQQNKPRLDKWWIKNVMCMFLQAMQLRFVQQADLEKSQNLQWLDVNRSVDSAKRSIARRKRRSDDRQLAEVWDKIDLEKRQRDIEEARMRPVASGTSEVPSSHEEEHQLLEENGEFAAVRSGSGSESRRRLPNGRGVDNDSDDGSERSPKQCVCCWCCCCRQRRQPTDRPLRQNLRSWILSRRRLHGGHYQYRCCNLDCTPSWFHALMGLVLGWLLAKTDFTQIFNDSMAALSDHSGSWQTAGPL